jgi:hypothetical protein
MERIPYRKTYEVVGYTYDADMHCVTCTTTRFGDKALSREILPNDSEGNPIHPVFLEEATNSDVCRECRRRLNE